MVGVTRRIRVTESLRSLQLLRVTTSLLCVNTCRCCVSPRAAAVSPRVTAVCHHVAVGSPRRCCVSPRCCCVTAVTTVSPLVSMPPPGGLDCHHMQLLLRQSRKRSPACYTPPVSSKTMSLFVLFLCVLHKNISHLEALLYVIICIITDVFIYI